MEDIMKEGRMEEIREEDRIYKDIKGSQLIKKTDRERDSERGSNERKRKRENERRKY